jgi:ribulose 1,5-bisphosphate carboxylase large subunit-like protein
MKYNHKDRVLYEIVKNGGVDFFKGDELVRELYNMPMASIKDVELHKKETCCGTTEWVTITTKQ